MSDSQLKSHAPKTALHWGGPPVIALVTTLLTGYFTTQESKIKASVEIAGINAKTGVSYEVLSKAVTTLETTVASQDTVSREIALQVAGLQGALKALLDQRSGRIDNPITLPSLPIAGNSGSGVRRPNALTLIPPEKLFGPKPKALDLPSNLEDAIQQRAK